jgi:hypothetical protein
MSQSEVLQQENSQVHGESEELVSVPDIKS